MLFPRKWELPRRLSKYFFYTIFLISCCPRTAPGPFKNSYLSTYMCGPIKRIRTKLRFLDHYVVFLCFKINFYFSVFCRVLPDHTRVPRLTNQFDRPTSGRRSGAAILDCWFFADPLALVLYGPAATSRGLQWSMVGTLDQVLPRPSFSFFLPRLIHTVDVRNPNVRFGKSNKI